MANGRIIELVKARSFLFDCKDPNHKNRQLTQMAWEEIGDELGYHAEEAKKKWRYCRDQYMRKKKALAAARENGAGPDEINKIISWPFFRRLTWLDGSLENQKEHLNFELDESMNTAYLIMGNEYVRLSAESTDDDDDLIDVETLVTPHSDSTSAQSVDSEGSMSNPVGRARNHVPLKRIKLEKLLQESLAHAMEQNATNLNNLKQKLSTTSQDTSIFNDYGRIVTKRLEDMGKKKASKVFTKILMVLDENDSD